MSVTDDGLIFGICLWLTRGMQPLTQVFQEAQPSVGEAGQRPYDWFGLSHDIQAPFLGLGVISQVLFTVTAAVG